MKKKYSNRFALLTFILLLGYSNQEIKSQVFTNVVVEKIADGFSFTEGPVWVDGLGLLFSDIPANKIYLFDLDSIVSLYKSPSGKSNGLTLDKNGKLILAQHLSRQIARMEDNGDFTSLTTQFDGKKLNSPNDLVVASDGSIFFTDPPYGLNDEGGTSELGYYGIYHLMPSGKIYLLDKTLSRPNGIVLNGDETKLIANDCEVRKFYTWEIESDSVVTNKNLFASMAPNGYADGMKMDSAGYLYSTGPGGIWIFAQDGTHLKTISVPGQTSNCAWGDADGKALYVTSGSALYRIRNKKESPPVSLIPESFKNKKASLIATPNPVYTNAIVSFTINEPGWVCLSVINLAGQKISTLAEGDFLTGEYSIEWKTSNIEKGIYFIVLDSKDKVESTRCIVSGAI